MDGLLLVDKPSGPTSFDVVRAVRRTIGVRKVGHSGTLDPMASGLLVVCVGQGTKLVPYLMDTEKRYRAKVRLGQSTDTDDALGQVLDCARVPELSPEKVNLALRSFQGEIEQVPPVFSAIKRGGEALHRKARRGEVVEVEPRVVMIYEISLVGIGLDTLDIDVRCGKGTYIRSLARDLGGALGTCGHLEELRRVATSGFQVDQAIGLDELKALDRDVEEIKRRLMWGAGIPGGLATLTITVDEERLVADGRWLEPAAERLIDIPVDTPVCLNGASGRLCAVARISKDGVVIMERIFT